jgi:hypothetical protein
MTSLDSLKTPQEKGATRTGDSSYTIVGRMQAFNVPATTGSTYGSIPTMPSGTVAVLFTVPASTYYTLDALSIPTATVGHQFTGGASDERVWPYTGFANQARFSAASSGSGYVTPLGWA